MCFGSLWCLNIQVRPMCRFWADECILKHAHGFFFTSRTIFLAAVAEIFVGRPDCGWVSTESLIFHFLIRVWTLHSQFLGLLLISFSCFIQFNDLFLQIFWQFFGFLHDSESRDVSARLCQEPWNSLNLYIHTDYKQTDRRFGLLPLVAIPTHLCQLVCMLSGQNLKGM